MGSTLQVPPGLLLPLLLFLFLLLFLPLPLPPAPAPVPAPVPAPATWNNSRTRFPPCRSPLASPAMM